MVFKDNWDFFSFLARNSSRGEGYDQIGGIPLRNCPEPDTALGKDGLFPYPTVMFTYMLIGLVSFIFVVTITFKYNSVRVFNKKIRTNQISNTLWIIFFFFLGVRVTFDAVRYGMNVVYETSDLNSGLHFASLVTDALLNMFLCLSLNHQLKFRSASRSPITRSSSTKSAHKDNLSRQPSSKLRADPLPEQENANVLRVSLVVLFSLETLFFALFILHLVFLYLNITSEAGDDIFYWLYIGAYILQRLPILILTLFIVLSAALTDGPSRTARMCLLLASILFLCVIAPPSILTDWFIRTDCEGYCSQACPFYIGSWVDFLQLLQLFSLLFYMGFIRFEYKRNMEECIWTTVSQIQDSFDVRRF